MKRNSYLFYIISFLETFTFTTAIWAFFFTSYLHFSFWQALFLITISWIVSTIFEVPSWAWADRFWRKKMYLLWLILSITDLIFWCFSTNFFSFIFAWIIAWLWYAMMTWNLEALIHDWLEETEKSEKIFKNITSNSYILLFLWRAFAAWVSWFLFTLNPLLPVYLTIIFTVFIVIFAIFLKEPKQILSEHKDNLSHLKETISFLFKHKNIFIFMLILRIISWIWNVYWFTQQVYFKSLWFSIEFIWITFSIGAIISSIWTYIYKRISNILEAKNILNIMLIILFIASILFSFFQKDFALLWLILTSIMFWFVMTFWNNYIIHKVPKNQKSTILSVFSLFITILYSTFNIILSLIVDKVSLFNIYLVNILLVLVLIIFNLLTFNKS